jgi:hypothetical protein
MFATMGGDLMTFGLSDGIGACARLCRVTLGLQWQFSILNPLIWRMTRCLGPGSQRAAGFSNGVPRCPWRLPSGVSHLSSVVWAGIISFKK